jgi:uncharacterized integral membrane protein
MLKQYPSHKGDCFMDSRNPLRHMILWNFIATGGLLVLLIVFNATTEAARAKIFEWLFVALIAALMGGFLMGLILWFFTFSARVTERSITYYYLRSWLSFGLLLGLLYTGIAWWYVNSNQWAAMPWTDAPYTRDVLLSVIWLIVVPLIGATRFIDSLYVETKNPSQKVKVKS